MAAVINTNINSLTAQRNQGISDKSLATAIQRLSSGLRINSAKDDAAGLAISERFTSQIRGLTQAARNANDGISLAQVTEGAMGSASSILQRVRELAIQAANATNSASDRQALQQEVGQLIAELDRISTSTEFNGQKLLDGTFGTAQFQIGANANQTIVAASANMRTTQYGNNQVVASGTGVAGGANGYALGRNADGTFAAPSGTSYNGVTSGVFYVNGALGQDAIEVSVSGTAKQIATDVNQVASITGVFATARTVAEVDFSALGTSSGSFSFQILSDNKNFESISFQLSEGSGPVALSSVISAINDKSSKTGVIASLSEDGTKVRLTNETGNDIIFADTDQANSADVVIKKMGVAITGELVTEPGPGVTLLADGAADGDPASAAVISGYLVFDSNKSFTLDMDNVSGSVVLEDSNSTLKQVSELDVSTVVKANDSLKTVDAALAYVSGERAKLGALQSRFETTINALTITTENLTASRSRIMDADFAAETAALSRAQILQQAGTAMIAQANQIPQGVLQLLQG